MRTLSLRLHPHVARLTFSRPTRRFQGVCTLSHLEQLRARVQRTSPARSTQIIGQRVRVGLRYAGQIVIIESARPPCASTTGATI